MIVIVRYLDGDNLMFINKFTTGLTSDKVNVYLRSKEIPADQLDQVFNIQQMISVS